jgi:hypothetical protein
MEQNMALSLYVLFRGEVYESTKLHRESLQNYLAFAATLLGATIAGSLVVRGIGWMGMIVLVGPVINVVVCMLAIRTCDRFYLGALERITILAKLESLLGILDYKPASVDHSKTPAFFRDRYLLPERWIWGEKYATADEFIKQKLNAGVNRLAKQTFGLLIAVNVLLGLALMLVALL